MRLYDGSSCCRPFDFMRQSKSTSIEIDRIQRRISRTTTTRCVVRCRKLAGQRRGGGRPSTPTPTPPPQRPRNRPCAMIDPAKTSLLCLLSGRWDATAASGRLRGARAARVGRFSESDRRCAVHRTATGARRSEELVGSANANGPEVGAPPTRTRRPNAPS